MTYMIDGRPITKRTRPELLTLVRRVDEERLTVQANNTFLVGERDTAASDRDKYKRKSVDSWCQLTTAEGKLSEAQALVVARDRTIKELRDDKRRLQFIATLCLAVAAGVLVALWFS